LENAAGVNTHLTHHIGAARRVADQSPDIDELAPFVHGWYRVPRRQRHQLIAPHLKEGVGGKHQRIRSPLRQH
jgi:hypothetical protein